MSRRSDIVCRDRWVVKIGSALLTRDGQGLDCPAVRRWVDQMAALGTDGVSVVLVSSGSITEGMIRLGWKKRPVAINELQAAAAVGQMGLVHLYETCFQAHDKHTAQILLTHEDFSDRARYLNARSTLRKLLDLNAVPVVNENDTVSTEQIKLGDNDTLAGLVSNLVEADVLVILTDCAGMYNKDPRHHDDAVLISEARVGDPHLKPMAGSGGTFGRGGMVTKLQASELAARSGTATIIVSGDEPDVLMRIRQGEQLGTLLYPEQAPVTARKRWLAGQLKVKGKLSLDDGAVSVLTGSGKSLLPVGVTASSGVYTRGELVACVDKHGIEVARGLVNYNAAETMKILGKPSGRIAELLGYVGEPELIHRDNLVLID